MTFVVYVHTHIVSGRRYVGLTKIGMMRRWGQHVRKAARGHAHPLSNAIRKHGAASFEHDELECLATLEAANEAEQWWIAHFGSDDRVLGFNLTPGGQTVAPDPAAAARRSATARAREAAMTPEAKTARAFRCLASLPPERRSEIARAREAAIPPERRAERMALVRRSCRR